MLHGFDLNIWEYLGSSKISYIDTNNVITSSCLVFFFCKKTDHNIRDFNVQYTHSFKYHTWIYESASLWKSNQKEIYQCINYEPSSFLKEYMLNKYKSIWSKENNWWTSGDVVKYESAKKEQIENKKKELTTSMENNNVVTVKFDKEKKKV